MHTSWTGPGLTFFTVATLALVACTSSDSSGDTNPDANASTGAVSCKDDARALVFAPDMKKASVAGDYAVRIVQGSPAPPGRGNNDWVVRLEDASGAAMPPTTFSVKSIMPMHGHGSPVTPTITPNPDGTYKVSPLYFFMPGLWEVTFIVDGKPATNTTILDFCVDG